MMCSNHNCSNEPNQALGLLLCLLVVAYIYYFTTNQAQNVPSQEQTNGPISAKSEADAVVEALSSTTSTHIDKLRQAFEAGTKAYMQFDIQDIRRIKLDMEELNHQSKEREKSIGKRLEESAKKEVEMEERMKAWREEQLRMIWGGKQKRERGLGAWFKFGTTVEGEGREVRDDILKRDVKVSVAKEVQFDEKA